MDISSSYASTITIASLLGILFLYRLTTKSKKVTVTMSNDLLKSMLNLIPESNLLWSPPKAGSNSHSQASMFLVTHNNGFLPFHKITTTLPSAFSQLEEILTNLPQLLKNSSPHALENVVLELPILNVKNVTKDSSLFHALLRDYSILSSAFIIEGKIKQGKPRTLVPPQISEPLFELAKAADLPTIMEYSSYCLGNSVCQSKLTMSNEWNSLCLVRALDGGPGEATFIIIHAEIESHCGNLVQAFSELFLYLRRAYSDSNDASINAVISALNKIKTITNKMLVSQLKMFNACNPKDYISLVRPWIFGWNTSNSDFPHGVTFQFQDGKSITNKLRGETGAQSTLIPSLDIVLDIHHSQDELRVMLKELEAYRPSTHREFLHQLRSICYGPGNEETLSSLSPHLLRYFINQNLNNTKLVRAFNDCIGNVWAFRAIHVVFAEVYISRFTDLTTATGGTPYKKYLAKHRTESGTAMIFGQDGSLSQPEFYKPSEDEAKADLDNIFTDNTQGIPKYLLQRHAKIISHYGTTTSGEFKKGLKCKCFPSQWARFV